MMKRLVAVATLVGMVLTAVGCGGGGGSSSSSGGGGGEGSTPAAVVSAAKTSVVAESKGTDRPLPTSGPAAETGKKVFAIPCSSEAPGCAAPVKAFKEAASKLGWDVTEANGKGTPAGEGAAINAAIAAKADGILLVAIDCPEVKAPLDKAKAAGIEIYSVYGVDCGDPLVDAGQSLFDGQISYGKYGGNSTFTAQGWNAVANYIIAETNGEANILMLEEKQPLVTAIYAEDFEQAISKCSGCTIYKLETSLEDLTTGALDEKVSAALTAHPDVNVVSGAYDAQVELGVAQAVESARAQGRELLLTSYGGSGLKLVREGAVDALGAAIPNEWTGWAAADGLNRVFAGEEQADPGIGVQLITQKNVPEGESYDGNPKSSGFRENYEQIWSGES